MSAANESSTTRRGFWRTVVLVSLVSVPIDITISSIRALWNDEAFTALASTLPSHDLLHLVLTQRDAVNATYDILMRPYIFATGHGTLILRIPSSLFMAITCAGIMTIARSLVGRRVAVYTGLAFAFLPLVTGFGSEARSYALSAAVVTWSTWFLLQFLYNPRNVRRWAWCYAISLVVTGYVFLYAFIIVVVHLLVAAGDPKIRRRMRSLLLLQGGALIAVSPLALLSLRQHQEISWIPSGFFTMISNGVGVFVTPFWSGMSAAPYTELLALLAWGVIASGLYRLVNGTEWTSGARTAVRLGLAWILVPGALYSLASAIGPYFTLRYLVFCVPAAALLLGLAFAHIRSLVVRSGFAIALALLVVMVDTPLFSSAGKDGWGTTMQVLTAHGAPGEFVLPSPQIASYDYTFVARVTGLPQQMTLIVLGGTLPWSSLSSVRRWSSTDVPPTHVIWLVSRFGAIDCTELATLRRWGFTATSLFGTRTSPTYEFVSPLPVATPSLKIACSTP
jgi:mannosyltransferase